MMRGTVVVACSLLFALQLRAAAAQQARDQSAEAQGEEAPRVLFFRANPPSILPGGSATLEWRTEHATSVLLSEVGEVEPSGSLQVAPRDSAAYELVASNAHNTVTEKVTVTVQVIWMSKDPPGNQLQ